MNIKDKVKEFDFERNARENAANSQKKKTSSTTRPSKKLGIRSMLNTNG